MKIPYELKILAFYFYTLSVVVLTTYCVNNAEGKECCEKTAQEVYEYEGWVVADCENCDEVD